jgi:hypothetical protein
MSRDGLQWEAERLRLNRAASVASIIWSPKWPQSVFLVDRNIRQFWARRGCANELAVVPWNLNGGRGRFAELRKLSG